VLIADDLFAGAGGWDLAAALLGIHARGVENMKEARATRDAAGLSTIHDDVWTFQPDGNAEGLIASPPCQTFSAAGKGAGRKALDDVLRGIRDNYTTSLDHLLYLGGEVGDDRTALVLTPLHFALTGDYEWLAWEQVPTVLPVWEACAEVLRAAGWSVWTGLLQAEMYGVPQTRKRAFLLASRRGEVRPPTPTHSRYYARTPDKLDPGVYKWVSMAEALGWWPVDSRCANAVAEWDHWSLRNNSSANAAERRPDQPAPTLYFGQRSNYCAWEWHGEGPAPELPEWAFNRPSTTIVGSFKPEIVAAPGYRTTVSRQNAPNSVRVSVHEAGILQSFPADYPWQGAKGKQFLQCGNAVPPGLALHALAAASGVDAREVAA
jgi:DNA (cytosine-5)-methyltransferase 1